MFISIACTICCLVVYCSDERHAKKKSKSSDKPHSSPAKDIAALLPPKKISHRSSSVSSDRSDHSAKSRSSVDKQSSRRTSGHTGVEHAPSSSSHSSKNRSKHSSSSNPSYHQSQSSSTHVPPALSGAVSQSAYHQQHSSLSTQSTNSTTTHSTHGASNK